MKVRSTGRVIPFRDTFFRYGKIHVYRIWIFACCATSPWFAERNNINRAAQRLFISQPPLSRHIRHLEGAAGADVILRHTKGGFLPKGGCWTWSRPLLALQERTLAALSQLSAHSQQPLRLGLTIAFEQGFRRRRRAALGEHNRALHIYTHAPLAQQVARCGLIALAEYR